MSLASHVYWFNSMLLQEAAQSHLLCNKCLNLLTKTKTCAPCGHSFCAKCTEGYQAGCQECKQSNQQMNTITIYDNKQVDGVISKMQYIKLSIDSLQNALAER